MKNADQPAMPIPLTDIQAEHISDYHQGLRTNGMTKREMMAMHIAQGLLVSAGYQGGHCRELAEYTVRYADALLAELEATK